MRVAIIDGDVSYPPTSGKRLRTLHLMLRLAQRHNITYIARCHGHGGEARQAKEFLHDHGIEPILVEHPLPEKSGLAFYGRLAANLFSPWPYSVTSHQSSAMRHAVRAFAAVNPVDLWQVEWSAYLPALGEREAEWRSALRGTDFQAARALADWKSAPRLLIAHNVDTLIWQRYYETARGLARRLFLKEQWRRFERFERWAFAEADGVVAVSADDAQLIRTQFGQPNVDVVDNGIDRAYFDGVSGRRDPARILFLGALDWRPNQDAVQLLLESIFPQVLAYEPCARLVIVGRNPPASLLQRAHSAPNVEVHADVPDVRPFLAECGVMAVPLRVGGGSRLKILEALACGLPVVSSRIGAEGLCLRANEHYTLADEGDMGAALVQAMRKPDAARRQAEKGRALVLEMYDWDTLARKLESVWEKLTHDHRAPVGLAVLRRP